jgi:hypothetical protein
MKKEELKPGVIVIHKKGHEYCIVGIGTHTETLEEMVVYQDIISGRFWIRPVGMFLEPGRFMTRGEDPQTTRRGGLDAGKEASGTSFS